MKETRYKNYYATKEGKIYSNNRNYPNGFKELKFKITKFGYKVHILRNENRTIHRFAHRLIAETFIPNPDNKTQVNHINGNKLDNRVENLEWSTSKENITHAIVNGLHKDSSGEGNPKAKLTWELVNKIRKEYFELTPKQKLCYRKEFCKKYGVSKYTITDIITYRTWNNRKDMLNNIK